MSSDPVEGADPRIAAALARAQELGTSDAQEHVAIYEDVHETLQQALAEAGADPATGNETQADENQGT